MEYVFKMSIGFFLLDHVGAQGSFVESRNCSCKSHDSFTPCLGAVSPMAPLFGVERQDQRRGQGELASRKHKL